MNFFFSLIKYIIQLYKHVIIKCLQRLFKGNNFMLSLIDYCTYESIATMDQILQV